MIFLDCDGVLADFHGAACEVHGKPKETADRWNFYENWGMTHNEFWKPIQELGESFYMDYVKPLPWAATVWHLCNEADDVIIATTCAHHPEGLMGKRRWVNYYMPDDEAEMIFITRKELLASPRRLLIDDNDDNIDAFRRYGGTAWTFPRDWNYLADYQATRMQVLAHNLEMWRANYGSGRYAFD